MSKKNKKTRKQTQVLKRFNELKKAALERGDLRKANRENEADNNQTEKSSHKPEKEFTSVNSIDYKHVSLESIEILNDMETVTDDKKEFESTIMELAIVNTDSVNAVDEILDPTTAVKKRKTQADIDREIVEKFYANPTPDMFASIWKRFYYGVHSHAYKVYGDWERAADAVQETFQKAWEKKDTYDPERGNYSTWLYSICYNICVTNIKKENAERAIDLDVGDVFDSTTYANVTQDSTIAVNDQRYYTVDDGKVVENTYDEIEQKIYDASVAEIQSMDPLFQKIITLKDMKSMTLREIAEQLDIKESRVKNCYYKNREILAETIKNKYGELYSVYKEAVKERSDAEDVYNLYKNGQEEDFGSTYYI